MSRQYEPEIPEEFDVDFIQSQLTKIQRSPNMISYYFNQLEARFCAGEHLKTLRKIKEFNQVVAEGIKTESEIAQARAELQKALIALKTVSGSRYATLAEDDELLTLEESIARKRANIQNLQPKPPEEPTRKPTPSTKEVREKMENWWQVKADDDDARDEFIRKRLAEMDEDERQELEELEREAELSEEYKQRKRYEIQSRYAKRKDKLFNDIPH